MMISLLLNEQKIEVPADTSLEKAAVNWGYTAPHFAIAINETFVPRSEYMDTLLQSGDRVEVVSPMQGG